VFQTSFNIEADMPHNWVEIVGAWGADNFGHLTIDRIALPSMSHGAEISLPSSNLATNCSLPPAFPYPQPTHDLSRLQLNAGWHTLEAWVANEGPVDKNNPSANPAALNINGLQLSVNQDAPTPPQIPRRPLP
jgi:hypothetical protein